MEKAQKCPRRQWIMNGVNAHQRKQKILAFEKTYQATSKALGAPPRRSLVVGDLWTRKHDVDSQRSVVAETSERGCSYNRRMVRPRKSKAKRHGMSSTSSKSPQQGNGKMMTQHTKEWSANQAPVAPSAPAQTCGSTDQYSDISSVSDRRGAGSSDSSSSYYSASSRTTSTEHKRSAPAGTQTSDELTRSRLVRIAQAAFTENSSSLEPRSSVDDTPRQGDNRAGGCLTVDHYYDWYTRQWNAYYKYNQDLARRAYAQQCQPSANAPHGQFHMPPPQPTYAQPPLEPPPLVPAPTNQRAAGRRAGRFDIAYTHVDAHAKIADLANAIRRMRPRVLIASCCDTEVATQMHMAMEQLGANTNTRGGGGSRAPMTDTQPTYSCVVFQDVFIAGLQSCVTNLKIEGKWSTHDGGCVLAAGLTIHTSERQGFDISVAAFGLTDSRRRSGGIHWDQLAKELVQRSVRLVAGEFGGVSFSRQANRLRLWLQAIRKHITCDLCAIKFRPDEKDGAVLEAMGTDAASAMLVIGHAEDIVMLGRMNLIVDDLTNQCVNDLPHDAPYASVGWTAVGRVKENVVELADTRCVGVSIRLG